jgi:hypothetical protein
LRTISRHLRGRPSPATVISVVALLVAISGTAYALPGTNTVNSGDIINGEVRNPDIHGDAVASGKIENGQVRKVDIRDTAVDSAKVQDESLTGADINNAALPTSGAAQSAAVVTLAGGAGTDVVTGQITTTGTSRVLIDATAELTGANSDERALCRVLLDGGQISLSYESTFDDIGTDNEATVSVVTSANNVSAGTHTVTMNCISLAGTVVKDDAGINAVGIPVP